MTSTLKDNLKYWRKKLERNTDEAVVLDVIRKLSKVEVTVEILQETGIGKVIRNFAKKPGNIGNHANSVLHKWREIVAHSSDSNTKNDRGKKKVRVEIEKSNPTKVASSLYFESNNGMEKSIFPDQKSNITGDACFVKKSFTKLSEILLSNSSTIKGTPKVNNSKLNKTLDVNETESHIKPNHNNYVLELSKDAGLEQMQTCKKIKSDCTKTARLFPQHSGNSSSSGSLNRDKKAYLSIHKQDDISTAPPKQYLLNCKTSVSDNNAAKKGSSKTKLKLNAKKEFTAAEASFEDCLGLNDLVVVKKKRSISKPNKIAKNHDAFPKTNYLKIPVEEKTLVKNHPANKSNSFQKKNNGIVLPTLSTPLTNYRPLPQKNANSSAKEKRVLTNEEAVKFISSRKEKTAVYSGRRNHHYSEVPSLYNMCMQILIDNIDAIECMGGTPYFIIKPVLERCTPSQLIAVENYNPYLLDDTQELWEVHCKRDFRNQVPDDNETWRDLYLRAHDERDQRLKNITANISASMSKSNPVRKAKLAYVDSVVKPPRDVARRQAKNGTNIPVNHTVKPVPSSKVMHRPVAPVVPAMSAAPVVPAMSAAEKKARIPPLMAKSLKSLKQCYRR